jgi:hypothetical protein
VAVGYAGDWGIDTAHVHSTATHELGHALDYALGDVSDRTDFRALHRQAMADYPAMNPYFHRPEEFFAEAYSQWSAGEHSGGDTGAGRMGRHFRMPPGLRHDMNAFMIQLEKGAEARSAREH